MNYQESLQYLDTLIPKNFRMELGPLKRFCAAFANPQTKLKSVHVCGTNGKGSTSTLLHQLMKGSGYKVGLFTSPHLIEVRERIRIGDELISPEKFAFYLQQIKEKSSELNEELSYFEAITLIAFLYFQDEKVDLAIFETGLGGRLDATNIKYTKKIYQLSKGEQLLRK